MTKRFEIIDILKGFSLFCIFLIHFTQQFEIESHFEYKNSILNTINNFLKGFVEIFLSGNVYLIFSLVFGLNLNYVLKNKSEKSFLIRLFLIFCIGVLHSLFYTGDILIYYSFFGLILLYINKLDTKIIYIILGISLIKIPLIIQIIATLNPDFQFLNPQEMLYLKEAQETYTSKNIWDVFEFNAIKGKEIAFKHYLITDRIGSIFSFFLIGLIIYKENVLLKMEQFYSRIKKYFLIIVAMLLSIVMLDKISFGSNYFFNVGLDIYFYSIKSILSSLLFILIILFLYNKKIKFRFFVLYGKSSLSIYLSQTLIGVFIFYNFGLNLANKIGLLHGIIIMTVSILCQIVFLNIWCKKFEKGPAEMMLYKLINKF